MNLRWPWGAVVVMCGWLCAAGCAGPTDPATIGPTPRPIAPPDQQAVQGAVDRGIEFLLDRQWRNGSWGSSDTKPVRVLCPVPGGHRAFKTGTTMLCIMALLAAEGDDPRITAALDRAEQWVAAHLTKVRRDSIPTLYNNWAHAYAIHALLGLARRPGLTDQRREVLAELTRLQIHLLSRYQSITGGWGYYNYNRRVSTPPNIVATSFMTATVMIALHDAQQAGYDVPKATTKLGMMSLRYARNPNGTFDYHMYIGHKETTHSLSKPAGSLARSQACNAAMYLWGDPRTTPAVIRTWLKRLYARNGWLSMARKTYTPHASHYAIAGYFYYYGHYYAAVCMDLLPAEERAYHQDFLTHLLLDKQEKDGSWWDFINYQYHQEYGTAFAVLTLQRCLGNS